MAIYDDQVIRDAKRRAEDEQRQAQQAASNEAAKRANEADREKEAVAQRKRDEAAQAEREAQFKASVRAEYPSMDNRTFEAEWPRLRSQALEQASARNIAEKRASAAEYF